MGFIEKICQFPELCGDVNAERTVWIFKACYEYEKSNPKGVFAINAADMADPYNRLKPISGWIESCADQKKASYCNDLILLTMLSHYVNEHKLVEFEEDQKQLLEMMLSVEDDFPDIKSVYQVQEASDGFWF
ncbi:MAG: hypothetical protein PHX80_04285 [Candidatus Nanoarchaeia archaeon]|nr:hypothetical protein [Candidatus Nanoarchaeia archaeon]